MCGWGMQPDRRESGPQLGGALCGPGPGKARGVGGGSVGCDDCAQPGPGRGQRIVVEMADAGRGQMRGDGERHVAVATDDNQGVVTGLQDPGRRGVAVPVGEACSFVREVYAHRQGRAGTFGVIHRQQYARVHQLLEQS